MKILIMFICVLFLPMNVLADSEADMIKQIRKKLQLSRVSYISCRLPTADCMAGYRALLSIDKTFPNLKLSILDISINRDEDKNFGSTTAKGDLKLSYDWEPREMAERLSIAQELDYEEAQKISDRLEEKFGFRIRVTSSHFLYETFYLKDLFLALEKISQLKLKESTLRILEGSQITFGPKFSDAFVFEFGDIEINPFATVSEMAIWLDELASLVDHFINIRSKIDDRFGHVVCGRHISLESVLPKCIRAAEALSRVDLSDLNGFDISNSNSIIGRDSLYFNKVEGVIKNMEFPYFATTNQIHDAIKAEL